MHQPSGAFVWYMGDRQSFLEAAEAAGHRQRQTHEARSSEPAASRTPVRSSVFTSASYAREVSLCLSLSCTGAVSVTAKRTYACTTHTDLSACQAKREFRDLSARASLSRASKRQHPLHSSFRATQLTPSAIAVCSTGGSLARGPCQLVVLSDRWKLKRPQLPTSS